MAGTLHRDCWEGDERRESGEVILPFPFTMAEVRHKAWLGEF